MKLPPEDLAQFILEGRQLNYNVVGTEIGRITLKSRQHFSPAIITAFPGCQLIIADPYTSLEGLYQIEAYDLVEDSEYYDPEGLLCWIVAVERFGCVDPEHGTVLVFPDADWQDIVRNPVLYLEEQWAGKHTVSEILLPWLHFPFELSDCDVTLQPYPDVCPVHQQTMTLGSPRARTLEDVLRHREVDDWISNCQASFPCYGVPANAREVKFCTYCRVAEDEWMGGVDEAIAPLEATPNPHGWVKCPGCGTRFHENDRQYFQLGVHVECGQKIRIVE